MLQFLACCALLLLPSVVHDVAATPSPIPVNFGTEFFGTDGQWSAAQIRVGTPEQYLWAYPNTVSSETWVISPGGCDVNSPCQAARGGVFYSNQSSTYDYMGPYDLVGTNRLGLTSNYGDYGLDNISVTDVVSAPSQVIASVTSPEIWLGQLGLSVKEVRLENLTRYTSIISTLVQNASVIPSHSYGYTSGAHYALKNVPGSLTLGGVDTTRFESNNASFSLALGYVPKVAVQSITVSSSQSQGLVALPPNWNSNPLTLMGRSQAAYFVIDTSTPFLWMPPAVCDAFASALNLTYNGTLQLYMFPNTTDLSSSPELLGNWDLSFTFTLANSTDSEIQFQLPITYEAFDLQLSYGFPNLNITYGSPSINYFPLRRANSSSQYTIGRAFLQETYLTVDYERNEFSLSPARFVDSTVLPNLVPITRPGGSTWPGPADSGTSSLSAGAKAGIGVAIAAILLGIAVAMFLFLQRRKRVHCGGEKSSDRKKCEFSKSPKLDVAPTVAVSELVGDRRHARELLVDSSNTRFELPGNAPIEMPADDVPEEFLAANRTSDEILDDVHAPAQMADSNSDEQRSMRKDYNIRKTVAERSESPAPPYSPSDAGDNTMSSSGGVSSLGSKSRGYGTHSSSGAAISPITPHSTSRPPDGPLSPASSNVHGSRRVSSRNNRPSMQDNSQNIVLLAPMSESSRRGSRNSRFVELVGGHSPASDTQEERPPLRQRFSWEE